MSFGLMVCGYKGLQVLRKINHRPKFVISYDNKERDDSLHYKQIKKVCKKRSFSFYNRCESTDSLFDDVNRVYLIGWQFLIKGNLDKIFVFHDSYIPNFRGFAPTVTAIQSGSDYIGVSCFNPIESKLPDYGKVYVREKIKLSDEMTVGKSFRLIAEKCANIIDGIQTNGLGPELKINWDNSSFSIWKNKDDMKIDWTKPNHSILKKIKSLSYPYYGATTMLNNKLYFVDRASLINNLSYIDSKLNCGKICFYENRNPVVMCGDGLLKLDRIKTLNNKEVKITGIRRKFM